MDPEDILRKVRDRESFLRFVKALAKERKEAHAIEKKQPKKWLADGARNWKNTEIESFLLACTLYFNRKRPDFKPEENPSWRMLAEFLYHGKIME
jgi:hypothetical protein